MYSIFFFLFFSQDRARSMLLQETRAKAVSLEEQLKMQGQIEEELKQVSVKWERGERVWGKEK